MSKPVVIISAGGTGGHIFPALAVARQLADKYDIVWVGGKVGMEKQIIPQNGYPLETVSVAGVRNKGALRKLMLPLTMLRALFECWLIIRKHRPVAVIGFGGYATFPILLASRILGKKTLIHEQNSVAGLTNRVLAKLVNQVLTAFPNVLSSAKTQLVGNPVRQEIIDITPANANTTGKLNILIVGGSLGAKALNDNVPLALNSIKDKIGVITHQVGRNDGSTVAEYYREHGLNANVVNFIDNMAEAYSNSDIIICRAGASTVAEVSCAGKCAIFVPYPYAVDDHQTHNAGYLVEQGAAFLLPQSKLTPDSLAILINDLNPDSCQQIGLKAKSLAITDSTAQICSAIS
ncbi:MAG: undecaprenyldiphospho-muramoylpentapeptide beta-N-acetylglucosaminyltransferase [Burkholderiales bacterium]|nr:undecaprenyldiphospho-muramoylpentapeptide beta-N-acetylglucosaminyltransferase [Burkholderiales bacterium]